MGKRGNPTKSLRGRTPWQSPPPRIPLPSTCSPYDFSRRAGEDLGDGDILLQNTKNLICGIGPIPFATGNFSQHSLLHQSIYRVLGTWICHPKIFLSNLDVHYWFHKDKSNKLPCRWRQALLQAGLTVVPV